MIRSFALLLLVTVGCDLPVEGEEGTGPVVVGTDPLPGAVGVDRAGPFRLSFDRPVYPRDLHRGRLRIESGARSAFLSAWLEPVERVVNVELLGEPLAPSVRYRMWVERVRDLELVPMAERYEIEFETGEQVTPRPESPVGYEQVAPVLARCGVAGCHGGDAPALGLDLSSGAGIRETAIGVTALRSQVGTQGDRPWHGAPTLDGLARIDVVGGVGRPGRSFLMYALLEEGGAGHAVPVDFELTREELVRLSRWVRAGAPTE